MINIQWRRPERATTEFPEAVAYALSCVGLEDLRLKLAAVGSIKTCHSLWGIHCDH